MHDLLHLHETVQKEEHFNDQANDHSNNQACIRGQPQALKQYISFQITSTAHADGVGKPDLAVLFCSVLLRRILKGPCQQL